MSHNHNESFSILQQRPLQSPVAPPASLGTDTGPGLLKEVIESFIEVGAILRLLLQLPETLLRHPAAAAAATA